MAITVWILKEGEYKNEDGMQENTLGRKGNRTG
jgi:hypothetical protein